MSTFTFKMELDGAVSSHSFKGKTKWDAVRRAVRFVRLMSQRTNSAIYFVH